MRPTPLVLALVSLGLTACPGAAHRPAPEPEGEAPPTAAVYGPAELAPRGMGGVAEPPPAPPALSSPAARCPEGFAPLGAVCHPAAPALVESRSACEREGGAACEAHAGAVLEVLEVAHERYEAIALGGGEGREATRLLARQLKQKLDGAERLGAAYEGVIALPAGPWRHHAQVQEGALWEHLAEGLTTIPAPAPLTPEQQSIFQAALEEKAAPVREKARDLYVQAVTGAAGLGLEDELIRWAQARLRAIDGSGAPAGEAEQE
ncbi:MAG: hypothetical protein P1V51_23015 [Deltaproteobacteria bacterium]|nr:hypothetical protein [Deltaproteobacteria bacterium]